MHPTELWLPCDHSSSRGGLCGDVALSALSQGCSTDAYRIIESLRLGKTSQIPNPNPAQPTMPTGCVPQCHISQLWNTCQ